MRSPPASATQAGPSGKAAAVVDRLVAAVRAGIARARSVSRGDRVLVGVSGGVDSVVLLDILARLRGPLDLWLAVVHVDHQLRPDSAEDAAFVQALGERLRLPVVVARRDVRAACRDAKWSLEDGARRVRYACFLEAARRYSAGGIALGHTADDQAETVLLRLIRGAGLTGLGAMPAVRTVEGVRIVRPLLGAWRREVTAYREAAGLAIREDATNAELAFTRNRIRHELLPLLERAYNPNMKASLTQLAEQSREEQEFVRAAARRQWKRVVKDGDQGRTALLIRAFGRQPQALQRELVREAVREVRGDLTGFEFRHWVEVEQLFTVRPVGAVVELPGGLAVRRERDRVVFHSASSGRADDAGAAAPRAPRGGHPGRAR